MSTEGAPEIRRRFAGGETTGTTARQNIAPWKGAGWEVASI
jgi:hypothetical protein